MPRQNPPTVARYYLMCMPRRYIRNPDLNVWVACTKAEHHEEQEWDTFTEHSRGSSDDECYKPVPFPEWVKKIEQFILRVLAVIEDTTSDRESDDWVEMFEDLRDLANDLRNDSGEKVSHTDEPGPEAKLHPEVKYTRAGLEAVILGYDACVHYLDGYPEPGDEALLEAARALIQSSV